MKCPNCGWKKIHKSRVVGRVTMPNIQRYVCPKCGTTGYAKKFGGK